MYTISLVTESHSSPFPLHLHHFSSITIFLSHFPLCLIFIIPLAPRRFSLSSASFSLYLRFLAAFLEVEPWPRPSGRRVPDGLAGRSFRTDPSTADPVLPQTPGGPGGNTYLKQVESQRTGEGVTAEPVFYCISSSNRLHFRVF